MEDWFQKTSAQFKQSWPQQEQQQQQPVRKEVFKFKCRMCTASFKYFNQMWKHINEQGHQVSNANHYLQQATQSSQQQTQQAAPADSEGGKEEEVVPKDDGDDKPAAAGAGEGVSQSQQADQDKSRKHKKHDDNTIRVNKAYLDEKFTRIKVLNQQYFVLQQLLKNPEISLVLLIDLIKGNISVKKKIAALRAEQEAQAQVADADATEPTVEAQTQASIATGAVAPAKIESSEDAQEEEAKKTEIEENEQEPRGSQAQSQTKKSPAEPEGSTSQANETSQDPPPALSPSKQEQQAMKDDLGSPMKLASPSQLMTSPIKATLPACSIDNSKEPEALGSPSKEERQEPQDAHDLKEVQKGEGSQAPNREGIASATQLLPKTPQQTQQQTQTQEQTQQQTEPQTQQQTQKQDPQEPVAAASIEQLLDDMKFLVIEDLIKANPEVMEKNYPSFYFNQYEKGGEQEKGSPIPQIEDDDPSKDALQEDNRAEKVIKFRSGLKDILNTTLQGIKNFDFAQQQAALNAIEQVSSSSSSEESSEEAHSQPIESAPTASQAQETAAATDYGGQSQQSWQVLPSQATMTQEVAGAPSASAEAPLVREELPVGEESSQKEGMEPAPSQKVDKDEEDYYSEEEKEEPSLNSFFPQPTAATENLPEKPIEADHAPGQQQSQEQQAQAQPATQSSAAKKAKEAQNMLESSSESSIPSAEEHEAKHGNISAPSSQASKQSVFNIEHHPANMKDQAPVQKQMTLPDQWTNTVAASKKVEGSPNRFFIHPFGHDSSASEIDEEDTPVKPSPGKHQGSTSPIIETTPATQPTQQQSSQVVRKRGRPRKDASKPAEKKILPAKRGRPRKQGNESTKPGRPQAGGEGSAPPKDLQVDTLSEISEETRAQETRMKSAEQPQTLSSAGEADKVARRESQGEVEPKLDNAQIEEELGVMSSSVKEISPPFESPLSKLSKIQSSSGASSSKKRKPNSELSSKSKVATRAKRRQSEPQGLKPKGRPPGKKREAKRGKTIVGSPLSSGDNYSPPAKGKRRRFKA